MTRAWLFVLMLCACEPVSRLQYDVCLKRGESVAAGQPFTLTTQSSWCENEIPECLVSIDGGTIALNVAQKSCFRTASGPLDCKVPPLASGGYQLLGSGLSFNVASGGSNFSGLPSCAP